MTTQKSKIHPAVRRLPYERNKRRKSEPLLPDLPKHVIVMILLKHPVKSLMRFRSVCKSWKALLSSPEFMKLQNRRQILVASCGEPRVELKSMDIEVSGAPPLVEVDFPGKSKYTPLQFFCDRLVLSILDAKKLFLWNPSRREKDELPGIGSADQDLYVFYDFGFDKLSNDYKVLRGNCYCPPSNDSGNVYYSDREKRREVLVYSRGRDSWRRVRDCPYDQVMGVTGAFVDGFLYWLVIQDSSFRIGCFDLAEERFMTLAQPEFDGHIVHLGVLEGFLCVVCNHYKGARGWTIWIMKKHGVVLQSWKKLMKIPLLLSTPFVIPLCISVSGEIVMQLTDRKIVKYNPGDKTAEYLVEKNFEIESIVYNESCLSPFIRRRKPTAEGQALLRRMKR